MAGNIRPRIKRLEGLARKQLPLADSVITVIEVFGDRGSGPELFERYELKNGGFVLTCENPPREEN